jgi:hypothetical protein
VKISLEASKWQVAQLQFAPNIKFGQTIIEQPAIKMLQQLIFNAYSTNMYPISADYIRLNVVSMF